MNDRFYTGNIKTDQSASSLQWRKVLKRDIWDIVSNFAFYPILGGIGTGVAACFIKGEGSSKICGDIFSGHLPVYNIFHASTCKKI